MPAIEPFAWSQAFSAVLRYVSQSSPAAHTLLNTQEVTAKATYSTMQGYMQELWEI